MVQFAVVDPNDKEQATAILVDGRLILNPSAEQKSSNLAVAFSQEYRSALALLSLRDRSKYSVSLDGGFYPVPSISTIRFRQVENLVENEGRELIKVIITMNATEMKSLNVDDDDVKIEFLVESDRIIFLLNSGKCLCVISIFFTFFRN